MWNAFEKSSSMIRTKTSGMILLLHGFVVASVTEMELSRQGDVRIVRSANAIISCFPLYPSEEMVSKETLKSI